MHANGKATGRNWRTADEAKLFNFGDCFRAHFYWDDGAEAYHLVDTREEAEKILRDLGFYEEVLGVTADGNTVHALPAGTLAV